MIKSRGMDKMEHVSLTNKKAEVAISDRTGFRARKIIKDREGHYLTIKGSTLT